MEIKEYWDNHSVESMYDKNLLELEIHAISRYLHKNDSVLDIGCGEGEGTTQYSKIVKDITGLDYSETRLEKLKERDCNIHTIKGDMRLLQEILKNKEYTKIITQRSLINLESFEDQKNVIASIHTLLDDKGIYLMLEGDLEGVDNLNKLRNSFGLNDINIKWHNLFFKRSELLQFTENLFQLIEEVDFSHYYFLTRAYNAIVLDPEIPKWNSRHNMVAKNIQKNIPNLKYNQNLSRTKLYVFKKINR